MAQIYAKTANVILVYQCISILEYKSNRVSVFDVRI